MAPTLKFEGTQQERRAFELFRKRVSFQLAGDFDGWFWNTLLLQATHREPAIRHAVLALSSLCEQYNRREDGGSAVSSYSGESPLALQQYNCAIAELTSTASKRRLAVDVCLMTCMLFTYFEVIRGHHGSAMWHIASGVRILSELQSNALQGKSSSGLRISAIPYVDLQSFEVIFNRLNSQAHGLGGVPLMRLSSTKAAAHIAGFLPEIPPAFRSLEEARHSYEYHSTQTILLSVPVASNPTPEQLAVPRKYLEIFDVWQEALQMFLKNAGNSLSIAGKQLARIMQLNRIFFVVNVKVATSERPLHVMHWDEHLEDFKQMTRLARTIVEQNETDMRTDPRYQHRFAIDMNCIAPLFSIASWCRDPILRREAVALLQRSHNQQGLFDAMIASRVCRRLIEIEEQGLGEVTCCADVPERARLSGLKVQFDAEGRVGALAYRKKPGALASKAKKFEDLFTVVPEKIDLGVGFTEPVNLIQDNVEARRLLWEGK